MTHHSHSSGVHLRCQRPALVIYSQKNLFGVLFTTKQKNGGKDPPFPLSGVHLRCQRPGSLFRLLCFLNCGCFGDLCPKVSQKLISYSDLFNLGRGLLLLYLIWFILTSKRGLNLICFPEQAVAKAFPQHHQEDSASRFFFKFTFTWQICWLELWLAILYFEEGNC